MNDAWHEAHSGNAAVEAKAVAAKGRNNNRMREFVEKVRGLNWRRRK